MKIQWNKVLVPGVFFFAGMLATYFYLVIVAEIYGDGCACLCKRW